MATETAEDAPEHVTIKRVAGYIGAEVHGIRLDEELDDATISAIRAALLKHKVLFFRGQSLDHARHIAFGRRFGELTGRSRPQGGGQADEFPEILTISPAIDLERYGVDYEAHYRTRWTTYITGWHSDVTHAVNPPSASILRAAKAPEYGGDTQWTNLAAAYQGLSKPIQDLADSLRAEHTFFAGYQMIESDPVDRQIIDMINEEPRAAIHPVVRIHPESGEKALFVNPSRTRRIIGLTPVESRQLLDLFFQQISRPEYTVRFRWEPGSVAFWDNRSTAHFAATDFTHLDAERVLYRVTISGDRPVGPGGFTSQLVTGRPLG